MAKNKIDGVIQAVRYDDQGQILWVRGFLRRGKIWSDHIQLDRQELIDKIKSGMNLVTGERIPYFGSTFETSNQIKVIKADQREILVAGDNGAKTDNLEGVPLI